jgi:hypothetical protein
MIAMGVLAVAPAAEVWSVDAIRRRRDHAPGRADGQSVFARWPLRLMQWLIALTYLSAAYSKLTAGGLAWFNGHTMAYHMMYRALGRGHEPALLLATLPPASHVVPSIATVLFELTFVVAVLRPRVAWVWLLAGIAFPLGVYVTMEIAFFQTILLYVVFIESIRRYAPRLALSSAGVRRRAR